MSSDVINTSGIGRPARRNRFSASVRHADVTTAQGAAVPFQRRVDYIKQLVDAGFGDRILLSTDWELGERETLNPDGLLFVTGRTIPHLKQLGLSEQQVRAITVGNPARFFTPGR